MALSVINSDVNVQGTLTASTNVPSVGATLDTHVNVNAAIQATKMIHQHMVNNQVFGPTTTIVAATQWIHLAKSAGTLTAFQAAIAVQATDVSRTVTVDLQKSTGGGAFATVLSSTINITNTTAVRTVVNSGAFTGGGTYVAGDLFQIVVTVAGGAGVQAQGLIVTLTTRENP